MGLVENFKQVVEVVQKIDNVGLYRQILSLQSDALNLMQENMSLRDEVRVLKEKLTIRGEITFESNAYWLDREGKRAGPFCSACQDTKEQLVRLQPFINVPGRHRCPSCKELFNIGPGDVSDSGFYTSPS